MTETVKLVSPSENWDRGELLVRQPRRPGERWGRALVRLDGQQKPVWLPELYTRWHLDEPQDPLERFGRGTFWIAPMLVKKLAGEQE